MRALSATVRRVPCRSPPSPLPTSRRVPRARIVQQSRSSELTNNTVLTTYTSPTHKLSPLARAENLSEEAAYRLRQPPSPTQLTASLPLQAQTRAAAIPWCGWWVQEKRRRRKRHSGVSCFCGRGYSRTARRRGAAAGGSPCRGAPRPSPSPAALLLDQLATHHRFRRHRHSHRRRCRYPFRRVGTTMLLNYFHPPPQSKTIFGGDNERQRAPGFVQRVYHRRLKTQPLGQPP